MPAAKHVSSKACVFSQKHTVVCMTEACRLVNNADIKEKDPLKKRIHATGDNSSANLLVAFKIHVTQ